MKKQTVFTDCRRTNQIIEFSPYQETRGRRVMFAAMGKSATLHKKGDGFAISVYEDLMGIFVPLTRAD